MEFAPIVPIRHLEKWGRVSKTHLVLAQHLTNSEYFDFYARRRQAGDTVILDNGAYEAHKPQEAEEYVHWIQALHPTVAVLPDYLLQPARKTLSKSLRFLDRYFEQVPADIEWMYVPQIDPSENLDKWVMSLQIATSDTRVGAFIKGVGLPRILATNFGNQRVQAAWWVKTNMPALRTHALGMAAGSPEEFNTLKLLKVDSIDSSAPVWRGLCGYALRDRLWPDIPFDPYSGLDGNEDLIKANLKEIGIDVDQRTN